VSLYLDTSVVVALLTEDARNLRASAFLQGSSEIPIISDFGSAEFSSVVAQRVRMGTITPDHGRAALAIFDA
jgi:uncharacterized protein with PIN domain